MTANVIASSFIASPPVADCRSRRRARRIPARRRWWNSTRRRRSARACARLRRASLDRKSATVRSRPPTSTRPLEYWRWRFRTWRAIRFGLATDSPRDCTDANIHDFDGGARGGMSESSAMRGMEVGDEARRQRDLEFVGLPAIAHVDPQFVTDRARSFGAKFGVRAADQSCGAREQVLDSRDSSRAP